MVGPSPIVTAAGFFQIDVYGAGVACTAGHTEPGAPPPEQVRTYEAGAGLTFEVDAGEHTVVLTAFSGDKEPIGSACYRGSFGAAAQVCLSLELQPVPDLSVCSVDGCPCLRDEDCEAALYCGPTQRCVPGCRTSEDCARADDGGAVALPLCDPASRACVGCTSPSDCVRAPSCQGNVSVRYPPGGSPCVGGACLYPQPAVEPCPFGCDEGACTARLEPPTNVRAVQAGTSTTVPLAVALGDTGGGGDAPSTRDVEVLADSRPRGSARTVTVSYMLNGDFANQTHVPATRQPSAGADVWTARLPKQPAGTRVYFYVTAVGWDGTTHYAPGDNRNFTYASN